MKLFNNSPNIKAIVASMVFVLAGCSTTTSPKPVAVDITPAPAEKPVEAAVITAVKATRIPVEQFHVALEDGITLDYQIEKTISRLNGKSCYAFITGTIKNGSDQILSKRSVVDFIVINQGEILFRDITYPLAAIPPGKAANLTLVSSPIHREGCPSYDTIKVALRKVVMRN